MWRAGRVPAICVVGLSAVPSLAADEQFRVDCTGICGTKCLRESIAVYYSQDMPAKHLLAVGRGRLR